MTTDAPFLAVQDLHVGYGPIMALRGCTLEVRAGEAVAVVGANGAGKTTLLRAICNMIPSAQGSVRFDGQLIGHARTYELAKRGILHVPEDRGVIGGLTVWENLRLAYDVRPASRSFDDALDEVFTRFPRLGDRRTQRAGSMSGGEQQMLALSRAIMNPPRILLLDEPSLGLSPAMVREAYRVLRDLKARGITILLVEQNVRSALRFAHRAYVLRHGAIVHQGAGQALLADSDLFNRYLGTA